MNILGRHLLIELYDCDRVALGDPDGVERSLLDAADRARATVLGHHFHRFEPQGVSGVVVIAESHISIHTWPEHGYAAVDIFTCGPHMRPEAGVRALAAAFGSRTVQVTEIARGLRVGAPVPMSLQPALARE